MSDLEHYDRELYEIDEQLGRLALLAGADLSRPEVVVALIKGQYGACMRPDALDAAHRMELRALLLLKYKIATECTEAFGPEECARIMAEQDARLRLRGFTPENQTKGRKA